MKNYLEHGKQKETKQGICVPMLEGKKQNKKQLQMNEEKRYQKESGKKGKKRA